MVIRGLEPEDSVDELTELLRRAYAPLAARGLRYVATWQTAEMTRERLSRGECLVVVEQGLLLGTIQLFPSEPDSECPYYRNPGVYHFGKFAVEPAQQGRGLGRALFDKVKELAASKGASELACDTAAPALDLIERYRRWGMSVVGEANFEITNYRSVVLSLPLGSAAAHVKGAV